MNQVKSIFTDDKIFDFVNVLLICLFTFLVAYPIMYIFFASISSGAAVETGRVTFWPVDVTPAAYVHVFQSTVFWRSYANGVFLTVAGSVFSMFVSVTGAYALSKQYLPGVRFFNFFVVFTMWFSAGTIPIFLNLQGLNLLNYAGLIIGFGKRVFNYSCTQCLCRNSR